MGEYKANIVQSKKLVVRLEWPADVPMLVEVELDHGFLQRVWKLMLICEKIKRTMNGSARVTIDNARCQYVAIHSEAPIRRVLSMAKVKEWRQLQCLWVRGDLVLGKVGQCRVMAGMRGSQTLIDQDGFWFEGGDGTSNSLVSVRLGKDWVRAELSA